MKLISIKPNTLKNTYKKLILTVSVLHCLSLFIHQKAHAVYIPRSVQKDIDNIVRDIYNPRDFPGTSPEELIAATQRELIQLTTEPDSWKMALHDALQKVVVENLLKPSEADRTMSTALRDRQWEIEAPSLWENFKKAAGKVLDSFVKASPQDAKKAIRIVDRIKALLARPKREDVAQGLPKKNKQKHKRIK